MDQKHIYRFQPNVDVRIALLLSKLADPPQELLSWLKELQAKAEADPGRPRFGVPDQLVKMNKQSLAQARAAVDPDYEPPAEPKPREGGVFQRRRLAAYGSSGMMCRCLRANRFW